ASLLVREQGVLRLARLDAVEVVREQALEKFMRSRALDLELTHVRDVESPGVGAHGAVLLEHPVVLNGHLPPGERHHLRAERDMAVVQGCPQQRRRHGADARRRPVSDRVGSGSYVSRRKLGTSSSSSGTSKPPSRSRDGRVGAAGRVIVSPASRRRRVRPGPNPVAITVTRTSSLIDSSMTAPKMTFALLSAALVTTSAASFTSKRPSSGGPVTLMRMPVAPSTDDSSSGDE